MNTIDISSKLRKERITICSAAIFDILLISLILTLLGSKFILAPGFSIDLNSDVLPETQVLENIITDSELTVLNAKGNTMIIFDDAIYNTQTFAQRMDSIDSTVNRGVLLIKAGKSLDAQTLLKICVSAKKGGFKKVHIATTQE